MNILRGALSGKGFKLFGIFKVFSGQNKFSVLIHKALKEIDAHNYLLINYLSGRIFELWKT
jgi:hypothetical protein